MGKITLKNNIDSEFTIEHKDGVGSKNITANDMKYIRNTVKELTEDSKLVPNDGDVLLLKGYHGVGDQGGGLFIWDSNEPKANHNGGTVIDPSKEFPSDWTLEDLKDSWFNTTNEGTGCWKRMFDGVVNVSWFGAVGDGETDDTKAVSKAIFNSEKITGYKDNKYKVSYFEINNDIKINDLIFLMVDAIRFKNEFHLNNVNFLNSGSSNSYIIIENNNNKFSINNCYFKDAQACAIYGKSTNTSSGVIENCVIENCGNNNSNGFAIAIRLDDPNNVTIKNNIIKDCVNWGILFRGSDLSGSKSVIGCIAEGNKVYASSTVNTGAQGISISGAYNCKIVNNIVGGFSDNGIDTQYCDFLVIESNSVSNCKDGVFCGDRIATNILINGNIFDGCQRALRAMLDTFDNAFIDNITFSNNIIKHGNQNATNIAQVLVTVENNNTCYIRNIIISNNNFSNAFATEAVIKLNSVTKSVVNGNSFMKDNAPNSIKVYGVSDNVSDSIIISNNIFSGNSNTALLVDGSSNRISIQTNIFIGNGTAVNLNSGSAILLKGNIYRSNTTNITNNASYTTIDDQIDYNNNEMLLYLPTSDPAVAGQLWSDSGTVKVSAG